MLLILASLAIASLLFCAYAIYCWIRHYKKGKDHEG
jgi:hypothetical protein